MHDVVHIKFRKGTTNGWWKVRTAVLSGKKWGGRRQERARLGRVSRTYGCQERPVSSPTAGCMGLLPWWEVYSLWYLVHRHVRLQLKKKKNERYPEWAKERKKVFSIVCMWSRRVPAWLGIQKYYEPEKEISEKHAHGRMCFSDARWTAGQVHSRVRYGGGGGHHPSLGSQKSTRET